MTDEPELIAAGVTRRVTSGSATGFAPFASISGASSSILAGLSRDDKFYRSVPMVSVTFKSGDERPAPSFTIAIDDLSFVNLVLSASIREIILAYGDGTVSRLQEPEDIARRLNGLVDQWEELSPLIRDFAQKLMAEAEKATTG